MTRSLKFFIFVCFLFHTVQVLALMPPMKLDDLEQDSNLIVDGKVLKVYPNGKEVDHACSVDRPHAAMLQVNKTYKGTEFKAVVIKFDKTEFKERCVGSPDHVHFVGEEGKFYLSCQLDQCRLTHWNGVKNEDSIF